MSFLSIMSGSFPNSDGSEHPMKLDPNEEASLINELRITPRDGEDFDACWRRTSRRRHEVVRDLSSEGVRLWLLADDVRFEALCRPGEVPPDAGCPWELPVGIDPAAVVERYFGHLANKLPMTFDALREECRLTLTLRQAGRWQLLYVLPYTHSDGQDSWQFIGGGPPLADPQLPKKVRNLGWRMPKPLREFYAFHDGFGSGHYDNPYGWSQLLEPCSRLRLLSDHVDTLANGADYDGRDLLEFFPDGTGNGQYFRRHTPEDDDPPTFDWDHETWELSGPADFFDFLDGELIRLEDE
jgi:hypothetical protein